jgi:type I restriction enzyme S subunit
MGSSPSGDACNDIGNGLPLLGGPADLGLVYPEPNRWTTSPTKVSRDKDILVCVRATIGEPRWSDGEYCIGRGLAIVRPKDRRLASDFLFHVIEGNQSRLREKGTGTTFKTISKDHLETVSVPMLPFDEQIAVGQFLRWMSTFTGDRVDWTVAPPLPERFQEQRRIVARIEELAAKINEARGLRQKAAEEAEALIGAELRAKFLTFAKVYPIKALEELTSHIIDGPHVTPHYLPNEFTGIPFVTVKNMVTGKLIFESLNYISEEDHRQFTARCKPEYGDVLYSKDGATRGRPCFVDTKKEFSFFVSVALIKPLRDRLDGRYLVHLLNSSWIKDLVVNRSRGDMIPHIVLREIRAFPIPLPALSEQHRIVNELDSLQSKVASLKRFQAETGAELNALLPSILDKAFNGAL